MDAAEFARIARSKRAPGVVELVWESQSATTSRAVARVAFAGLMELLPPDQGGRGVKHARDFEKPDLNERQWAGLRSEVRHNLRLDIFDDERKWTGDWPSDATYGQISGMAGVSRATIQNWRKDPEYLRGFFCLLFENL